MLPYWFDAIVPDLLTGKTVLVAAHGNSLRALVKHLDGISDENIAGLNIPTGIPLSYELDSDFKPVKPGGPTWTLRRLRLPLRRSRTRGRRSRVCDHAPELREWRGSGHFHGPGPLWALSAGDQSGRRALPSAFRARSRLVGIRWAYTLSVSPGSECPRYSLTALMLSPASSSTDA